MDKAQPIFGLMCCTHTKNSLQRFNMKIKVSKTAFDNRINLSDCLQVREGRKIRVTWSSSVGGEQGPQLSTRRKQDASRNSGRAAGNESRDGGPKEKYRKGEKFEPGEQIRRDSHIPVT